MARAGVRALEYYDPATKKHGQAHMQARYAIISNLDPERTDGIKTRHHAALVTIRSSEPGGSP
jgi:hypothetical protein